jgi:periplasmic mercuric ion binding protein
VIEGETMLRTMLMLSATVLFVGCGEEPTPFKETTGTPSVSPEATPVSFKAGDTLTLEVPEMHCQFGCYPTVKETLEKFEGVETVELVPQKDEVDLDDHRVTVKLKGDFDVEAATKALAEAGFGNSKLDTKN